MPKISFVLKSPESIKDSPVILLYTCQDGRVRYYTGEHANKNTWVGQASKNKGVNAQLTRIRQVVEQLAVDYKIKGDALTKGTVIAALDKLLHKSKVHSTDLFQDMTLIVDEMESGKRLTPAKKKYSKLSIKTYRFTIEFLKAFDPSLKQSTISIETYKRFIVYCQNKNYSTNYIGSQIKNWKTLGKAVGGNPVFDHPEFKKMVEDAFDIYLDETELKKMMDKKMPTKRMELARDWFILDCYTGLRVSDLLLLNKQNLSKGFITIANKKTDQRVIIPVHPMAKKVLDKHKGFPSPITDVEINRVIKDVAKLAGIKTKVLFTITKGGKRHDEYLEKWQMISNHTARRSFITNLLKNGVPDTIVMKLTGIRSALTLKRYDKLSGQEAATIAAGHEFFK